MITIRQKLIVPVLIILGLVIIGGGYYYWQKSATPGEVSQAGWKTLDNPTYKFKVSYPADWKIIDGSAERGGQQFRGVAVEGPMRYDLPGAEKTGARYLLVMEFKDSFTTSDVTVQLNGFARPKQAGETKPTLVEVPNLEKTSEYQVAQAIIKSVSLTK